MVILEVLRIYTVFSITIAGACFIVDKTSPTTNAASVMDLNELFDTLIASDMDMADSAILLKLVINLDTESDMDTLSLMLL